MHFTSVPSGPQNAPSDNKSTQSPNYLTNRCAITRRRPPFRILIKLPHMVWPLRPAWKVIAGIHSSMDSFDLDMCNRIGSGGKVAENGGAAADVHRIKALVFSGNCIIQPHLVLLWISFGEFLNHPLKIQRWLLWALP